MAAPRITSDMTPTTCGGAKLADGKKKPVTLVSTVVARKSAVAQPPDCRPPSQPSATTMPERIPTRLMMTCTVVKVDVDNPRIMAHAPSRLKRDDITRETDRTELGFR